MPASPSLLVRIGACACALLIAGCATKEAPPPEELRAAALAETTKVPDAWVAPTAADSTGSLDGWIAAFGDPALPPLVAEAIAHNPDLKIAIERVERATASLGVARSGLRPQVDLIAKGNTRAGSDDSSGISGVFINASWEIDLWGRVRGQKAASTFNLTATENDRRWAERSLAAAVARAWFTLAELRLQTGYVNAAAAAAGRQEEIAAQRLRIGRGDERDLALARAARATYLDRALELERSRLEATRALELLLGRYPSATLAGPASLPSRPGPVPAGVPLEALDRRPDLASARARVDAAYARTGEAQAARLPRLAITATGGALDSSVVELKPSFENPFIGIGANLFMPLYAGGALKSQAEGRLSEQRIAVIGYGAVVLRALNEVENALAAEQNLAARRPVLQTAAAESTYALTLEETAYRVGKTDQRSVLQQQLAVLSARSALIQVEGATLQTRVALHLALGGDFEVPKAP